MTPRTAGSAGGVQGRRRVWLHPLLVPFPIGCWPVSLIFDVVSRAGSRPVEFTTASTWAMGIGLLAAVVAAATGFADALPIPPDTLAYRRFILHMSLVFVVIVAYLIDYLMRLGAAPDSAVPLGLLLLSAATTAVLVAAMVAGAVVAHLRRAVAMEPRGDAVAVQEEPGAGTQ